MTHPRLLIMAPLRGVTDDAYRAAFQRHFGGFDRAISPFLTPIGRGGPRQAEILRAARAQRAELPSTPQILTADVDDFTEVARRLADAGCREVNWNLGCPHIPVVRRKRGSGMLPHPQLIDRFLERVVPSCPVAISVKMRLGLVRAEESLEVLRVLEDYPLTEVTIHARVGEQMYDGVVDLDGFAACLAETSHSVIYNGDIVSDEQVSGLEASFPSVASWMIGRGALRDPTLPARIKGVELSEVLERHRRLHDELYAEARQRLSGPGHVLGRMKGLWTYHVESLGLPKRIFKRLRKATTLEAYEGAVEDVFEFAAG